MDGRTEFRREQKEKKLRAATSWRDMTQKEISFPDQSDNVPFLIIMSHSYIRFFTTISCLKLKKYNPEFLEFQLFSKSWVQIKSEPGDMLTLN